MVRKIMFVIVGFVSAVLHPYHDDHKSEYVVGSVFLVFGLSSGRIRGVGGELVNEIVPQSVSECSHR